MHNSDDIDDDDPFGIRELCSDDDKLAESQLGIPRKHCCSSKRITLAKCYTSRQPDYEEKNDQTTSTTTCKTSTLLLTITGKHEGKSFPALIIDLERNEYEISTMKQRNDGK